MPTISTTVACSRYILILYSGHQRSLTVRSRSDQVISTLNFYSYILQSNTPHAHWSKSSDRYLFFRPFTNSASLEGTNKALASRSAETQWLPFPTGSTVLSISYRIVRSCSRFRFLIWIRVSAQSTTYCDSLNPSTTSANSHSGAQILYHVPVTQVAPWKACYLCFDTFHCFLLVLGRLPSRFPQDIRCWR